MFVIFNYKLDNTVTQYTMIKSQANEYSAAESSYDYKCHALLKHEKDMEHQNQNIENKPMEIKISHV